MELCRSGSGIPMALKIAKNEDHYDVIHTSLAAKRQTSINVLKVSSF